MSLSDKEIKSLMDQAESYVKLGEKGEFTYLKNAVACYDEIIKNAPPHPRYFAERASIKHLTTSTIFKYSLDDVIKDMDRAIELNPDYGRYYVERGVYLLDKWETEKNISNRKLLEKSIEDFDACTHKDPTYFDAWLYLMEANILLERWDYVISRYGECGPYMKNEYDRLIRSWLGCLAMAFAGDPIDEADKQPLYDHTHDRKINLGMEKCIIHILAVFEELKEKESYGERWREVNKINELFFAHVCDLAAKGYILLRLGRHEEAIKSFDKALKLNPHDYMARMSKFFALVILKRYGRAVCTIGRSLFPLIRLFIGSRRKGKE